MAANEPKWFVVHTYSGYENKVMANIEKLVENRSIHELIPEVQVPMEEVTEIKDGEKRVVLRKKYPGYVFVKMTMNDETWFVVRNTRGVTGFVGPASKPVPLTDAEIDEMGVETKIITLNFQVGDNVRIKSGPLENFTGIVNEISMEKKMVTINVSMFGRETPVDLEFSQIEAVV
ncbi:MAG: transcription termination/antitermination protein NusG [Clostridiales bacterium]|jgi:transcriptional antiterminator NusG|nr:transcription termination/antitermination protein NusG [Clostridiales bacterium]